MQQACDAASIVGRLDGSSGYLTPSGCPPKKLAERPAPTLAPMREREFGAAPPLARLLLLASRWFDVRSRDELERRGWPRLSAAQSLLFAHLAEDGVTAAELARRLGNSRQATHELVQGLVRLGLLELTDDPRRRGGRLVCLTPAGRNLALDAYEILEELEAGLGADRAGALRTVLLDLDLDPGDVA